MCVLPPPLPLPHLIPPSSARDTALDLQLQSLSFIRPRNLDIPFESRHHRLWWRAAAADLRRMHLFRSPRDKVTCVLHCCRRLSEMLRVASADGIPPGADDFLPVLIFAVLRARPPRLLSQLQYITSFRDPAKVGVAGGGRLGSSIACSIAFHPAAYLALPLPHIPLPTPPAHV